MFLSKKKKHIYYAPFKIPIIRREIPCDHCNLYRGSFYITAYQGASKVEKWGSISRYIYYIPRFHPSDHWVILL